jgi:Ribbon-helix-helix protein, copG family
MIRSQVQLTNDQVRALKELAHRENTPVAELIRRAVDYWLRSASPISLDERRRRAIAAAQGFHSGIDDISERHDDYLAEIHGETAD